MTPETLKRLKQTSHDRIRESTPTRLVGALAMLVVSSTLAATLAAFGARWNHLCELAAHWPLQITLAAALACTVLMLIKRWKWAVAAGAVALLNASYIVPLLIPQRSDSATGPVYRAVSANIQTSNRATQPFLQFIRNVDPDFFLVLEIDDRWQQELAGLESRYPFLVAQPRRGNFGIALFSRHPIVSHRIVSLDDSGVPTILATLDLHGLLLNVVGTHPLPPVGSRRSELRDDHLRALGSLVSRLSPPIVVLGDLNTTSWSPCFRELLRKTHLRDSRQGFGVQPSWPTSPWILRIPIDHALVSHDLIVMQRYVGPDIGSDHLPIVVAFALQKDGKD